MSDLREHLKPSLEARHESLRHPAGLNADVLDALVLLARGSRGCADIGRGHDSVSSLVQEMHSRRKRQLLLNLGFSDADAEEMPPPLLEFRGSV